MKALMSENETFVADLNILISVLFIISKHGKIRCSTCFTNKEIIMLRSKSWCVVLPVNWWLGLCIFFTSINCWLWSLRSFFYIVLFLQKLNLHGSRQSQFLLWKVTKDTLWGHVLNEMYHSALNLSLRVAYELEQEQEVCSIWTTSLLEFFVHFNWF